MILLITPSERVRACAPSFQQATSEVIHTADSLRQGTAKLRVQEYSVVAIDQFLLETEPEASEALMEHLGTAIPLPLNFAVSGQERIVRELRAALTRRQREHLAARQAVEQDLRNQLRNTVTALLLSCDLANAPKLPPGIKERLKTAHGLLQRLSDELGLRGG